MGVMSGVVFWVREVGGFGFREAWDRSFPSTLIAIHIAWSIDLGSKSWTSVLISSLSPLTN